MLNPDGTVNLRDAEHALKQAEAAYKKAIADARTAERAYMGARRYSMAKTRAMQDLAIARSNADGALEAVQRARGAVHEALNPELS
jgi:multidrug efflux pump subunit AcrA (membrane-fusion protein)